ATRREFEHDICALPLEYAPRTRSLYSDLDFILLGFLAEDRGMTTLTQQLATIVHRLDTVVPRPEASFLAFEVPVSARARTAPTVALPEDSRRGRTLRGEVHDNYAAALGGVAGHAGPFGDAPPGGRGARTVPPAGARGPTPPPPVPP